MAFTWGFYDKQVGDGEPTPYGVRRIGWFANDGGSTGGEMDFGGFRPAHINFNQMGAAVQSKIVVNELASGTVDDTLMPSAITVVMPADCYGTFEVTLV